jgi:hypothetical protein
MRNLFSRVNRADGRLSLTSDSKGGTNFLVNPHNGGATHTIADVAGVAAKHFHEGANLLV